MVSGCFWICSWRGHSHWGVRVAVVFVGFPPFFSGVVGLLGVVRFRGGAWSSWLARLRCCVGIVVVASCWCGLWSLECAWGVVWYGSLVWGLCWCGGLG